MTSLLPTESQQGDRDHRCHEQLPRKQPTRKAEHLYFDVPVGPRRSRATGQADEESERGRITATGP